MRVSSVRELLQELGLRPVGGNYRQIRKHLARLCISTSHFKGRAWNRGCTGTFRPRIPLAEILVCPSNYPTFALKKRLIRAGLKNQCCELCGWAARSPDGRIPLELDHVNGDPVDNRLGNLRILCPNCHSLQPTHRGLNSRRLHRS